MKAYSRDPFSAATRSRAAKNIGGGFSIGAIFYVDAFRSKHSVKLTPQEKADSLGGFSAEIRAPVKLAFRRHPSSIKRYWIRRSSSNTAADHVSFFMTGQMFLRGREK